MEMKKEIDVFSISKVCMDSYKSKYEKAQAKKKRRFEDLNKNFVPGSPMFIETRDKITPECEKEIEAARDEALTAFEDALEKAIACERAHTMIISNETTRLMSVLDCLKDSPVSADEYNALVEAHGNKSYWADRFFERIAEKNGIFETRVQPSLTAKLEILNELAENTRDCLNNYNGEDKTFLVTSSDHYIFGLEDRFTNGYSGVRMGNGETAKRLVDKALNCGDSMERAVVLSNMLRTSKPDMQDEILSVLAEGEYLALSDPTMRFTGVKNIVDRFKKEDGELIKAAEKAVERIKNGKTREETSGTIYDNLGNRHFVKKFEKYLDDSGDKKLRESYETAWEVKREETNKANKGD